MFGLNVPQPMSHSLRVLAALLSYPDQRMRSHLAEMRELLHAERALPEKRLAELDSLLRTIGRTEPLEAEADYVELFDRSRGTSLHLFEHVHGDSRERGPALIDLGQTYAQAGLMLDEGELPDYLPAMLEFVSTQPPREAQAFLGETAHILNMIFGALLHRDSPYASVLGALLELAGETAAPVAPAPEPSIDETWAEPAVFSGCSTEGQARPGQPQPIHIVRKHSQPGASA